MTDTLVKINEINHDLLNINHDKLYLNIKPLKFQSSLLTCLNGIEIGEGKTTKIFIAEKDIKMYQELDNLILNLIFKSKFKYQSFLNLDLNSGVYLNLDLSSTVFYDDDKTKLTNDAPILSSNFKAYFLLDLSYINYTEEILNANENENENANEIVSIKLRTVQVRIKSTNVLPRGCFIYSDYEDLKKFLMKENSHQSAADGQSQEKFLEENIDSLNLNLNLTNDVNELLS